MRRAAGDAVGPLIRREIRTALREYGVDQAVPLGELADRLDWLENEVKRLGPHVAAQEVRVGRLESGYEPPAEPAAADVAAEHARIRARSAYVSQMEERLNRVEIAVQAVLENLEARRP